MCERCTYLTESYRLVNQTVFYLCVQFLYKRITVSISGIFDLTGDVKSSYDLGDSESEGHLQPLGGGDDSFVRFAAIFPRDLVVLSRFVRFGGGQNPHNKLAHLDQHPDSRTPQEIDMLSRRWNRPIITFDHAI